MNLFTLFESFSIDRVIDWVELLITHFGVYMSLLLLLLEEAGVPLPVPGDVILAYSGYQIQKGAVSYPVVFCLALASVLIGSSILYYLSRRFGPTLVLKLGKYVHVNQGKIIIVEEKFRKYGPIVIIFGRHIPGFRIPITIVAGVSKISYKIFIFSTFLSVVGWIPAYILFGQHLGPKTLRLFHAHPWYIFLAISPSLFFLGSIIYVHFQKPKK